ncbi:MAG: hypothetical protein IT393_02960, partial [Nitrospirae bacterium]|nr:hypothetical protein [Nitrospirota bacterium]
MRKIALTIIVILQIFSFHKITFALNVETHKAINLNIAQSTLDGFSVDYYLKNNLGFPEGIGETFNGQRVELWLEIGGEYEDKPPWTLPYLRSVNHFHNPITNEGYSGIWGTGFLSGMSSTQWALLPQSTQSPGGYYSWSDVRNYYFTALTSTDQNIRNSNFAQTFRGLGQLMHLVQDVSVPAHTRDDGHLLYNYEKYAESYVSKSGVPAPTSSHFFDGTINDIASFIDTNQYDGTNPDITAGNIIGLSEYTSANFFSEDTIDSTDITFPRLTSAQVASRIFIRDSGGTYTRHYYLKMQEGERNNGQGYLLAAVDWLEHYRQKYPALSLFLKETPVLDDNIYKDYASLLLPRAVGYSAALIDYFFRGELDFMVDEGDRVDGVKGVRVTNLSDEEMDGTFSLYYDATDGNRHLLGSWSLLIAPQGTSPTLSFTFPNNNIEYHRYILVFRGRMGLEEDAVAGYIHGAGWREEWDTGLYDNHNWIYSETDMAGQNPANGETVNQIVSGKLVKENIRYANSDMARINETYIGVAD